MRTLSPELSDYFHSFDLDRELSLRSRSDLRTKSPPLRSGKFSGLLAEIHRQRARRPTTGTTIGTTGARAHGRRGASLSVVRRIANSRARFFVTTRDQSSRFILAVGAKRKTGRRKNGCRSRSGFSSPAARRRCSSLAARPMRNNWPDCGQRFPTRRFASPRTFRSRIWPLFWKNARSFSAMTAAFPILRRPSVPDAFCSSGQVIPRFGLRPTPTCGSSERAAE